MYISYIYLEKEMAILSSILSWNAMDRAAWQATVHGVAKVRYNLTTKQPPPCIYIFLNFLSIYFHNNKSDISAKVIITIFY